MFGFHRKKKTSVAGTADTFSEATGGGWSGEPPQRVRGDGGSHADFVRQTLKRAQTYALENDIPVGQEFEFQITDIPVGISGPHEIIFALMMQAQSYGLRAIAVADEKAYFARFQ